MADFIELDGICDYPDHGKEGTASDQPGSLVCGLEQFASSLAVRNYSPETIEQRVRVVMAFMAWARPSAVTQALQVTPDLIERYRAHLFQHRKPNGEPLGMRTQTVRLVALRAFFRWLTRERIIASDPTAELELPRGEKRLPGAILTEEEVEVILALPNVDTALGLRDRAVLETLYVTGIRRLELTRLRPRDIDYARQLIFVRKGKGRKDRMVPTGERLLAWLLAYQSIARPRLICQTDTDFLFVTSWGTPLHPKKLTARVSAYVTKAKLGKRGSCHLFRHAAATHMLENGADIRFIQAMLGHESLDTTRIYTHVSIAPLAAVHAATHPAAKFKAHDFGPPASAGFR